jgi:hypothetical protein
MMAGDEKPLTKEELQQIKRRPKAFGVTRRPSPKPVRATGTDGQ